MDNQEILDLVRRKAQLWLSESYDEETRQNVKYLLENDEKELVEAFYKDLEFGTGGLRGIMGPGTNRMNIYTVGMATQGLCNYLNAEFNDVENKKVVIAYDCRNNSSLFAETAAGIFSANGFRVYLFDSLRPTPELSFAIREIGCVSGIVITASHNPKEYNGFKAYWCDGGQLVSPHDTNVIAEVQKITGPEQVKFEAVKENIKLIGVEFDKLYIDRLVGLSLSPDVIERNKDLKIVYTPIHGSGVRLVPEVLKSFGFTNVYNVPEQDEVNGDFPTVHSPNPEETAAMNMALEKAASIDADLVMATDPDADRVGIGVKNNNGEFILLNGNQAAALLINYLLTKWSEKGKLKGKEYIVKTIVTSELLVEIAKKFNVEYFDVLTGFKFIAEIIKENEGKKTFIGGGEESYGYLAGEFVRDKDAVISCALLAETAAWARDNGNTMFNQLLDIYREFGFFKEGLRSVVIKGKEGAEEIQRMMVKYRSAPPTSFMGSKVVCIKDYHLQKQVNTLSGEVTVIDLPKSNVLQFITEDGSKISVRPSGTEPKIKFYIGVKGILRTNEEYENTNRELEMKIEKIYHEII